MLTEVAHQVGWVDFKQQMPTMTTFVIFVAFLALCHAFTPPFGHRQSASRSTLSRSLSMSKSDEENDLTGEVSYDGVFVSGFISKETEISEPFVFNRLWASSKWSKITALTDDVKFARKRMVTPTSVYTGLIDILEYSTNLEETIGDHEAWIAFNVSSSDLNAMAKVAADKKLKRVVFAVPVEEKDSGAGVVFKSACDTLSKASVDYTILKFGSNEAIRMGEDKFPYRIVRGEMAMPTSGDILSSDDLMRIIAEVVDIPKTFNNVYGIGAGSKVDTEILTFMKSQGWPERVQIGLLCGDFMEKAEKAYAEEMKAIEAGGERKTTGKKRRSINKFAGFATI
jgi:hypothetical protein